MQAAESLVEQVIKQCREGRFTGLLRVRAKEGDGELRFLSGIRDEVRFGVSTGDEALERLMRATNPKFEAVARLPGLTGGFKQRLPHEGPLGEIRPIDLFRYCETYALTCTLELNSRGRQARAIYQVGELTSLDTDQAGEDAVAGLLDATEGTYRFELPPLELPEGISVHLSQPPPGAEPISTDFGAGAPTSAPTDEPAVLRAEQELKRKAAEVAEAKKRSATPTGTPAAKLGETDADLVRKLEEESRRKAQAEEEARRRREEEERRKAQAAEEARRRAEAEAQRKAEEARRRAEEEARRKAQAEAEEAKRRAQAEEARRKAEAEAARRAEEEAEARRKAEAEAARRAEEEAEARRKAEAEAARRAEEEAEARRKAEEEAEAATRRKLEAERAAASAKATAVTEKRKAKDAPASRAESAKLAAREDEEPEFARKGGNAGKIVVLLLVVAAVVAFLLMNR